MNNTKLIFSLLLLIAFSTFTNASAVSQINIDESAGQTEPPFTVKDNGGNVLFRIINDGKAIINEFIQFSGSGLTSIRNYIFPDTSGTVVIHNATQTLTGKTIDANDNTLSNLAHGTEVDNPSSGVHGVTGSVVGTSDTQTLTGKTLNADSNTITNIDDDEIKASAGISWSKISKTGSSIHDLGNVTSSGCPAGQILKVSGTSWGCANDDGTKGAESYHRTGGTRWYSVNTYTSGTTATQAVTTNVMRAFPFIVGTGFSIDRIQFEVTTAAGGSNCIVGIYNSDSNLYPLNRIVSGTAQSTATTGLKPSTISTTLSSQTLYWLVYNCGGTPTVRSIPVANIPNVLGNSGAVGASTSGTGWTVARVYDGTLPATYPGGGSILTNTGAMRISVRAT